MLKFQKGDFQRFLVSQDLSQKRHIVAELVESKLVVVLTKDNKTKLHLLSWSESNWHMTIVTEIPFGDVLDCFVADDAILLATPDQCILMRNNLDEIKTQPNKFMLRDTAQSSNQEHTLLFSL